MNRIQWTDPDDEDYSQSFSSLDAAVLAVVCVGVLLWYALAT
jgi:hypothetical protein